LRNYLRSLRVESFAGLQEKRFKVLPRRPRTDLVQIAMAAASLFAAVGFNPFRTFTVRRTFPIQRQNTFASDDGI
jgi:hypothetical protein